LLVRHALITFDWEEGGSGHDPDIDKFFGRGLFLVFDRVRHG
jgi:hypothetical protein